jgi:hypothetical protein
MEKDKKTCLMIETDKAREGGQVVITSSPH